MFRHARSLLSITAFSLLFAIALGAVPGCSNDGLGRHFLLFSNAFCYSLIAGSPDSARPIDECPEGTARTPVNRFEEPALWT